MAKKQKPAGADGHRERMFNKLIASGDSEILPRDTLEMLLYFPVRVRDTRDIAVDLMESFGGDFNRVLSASSEELCKINGVGPATANFLGVVGNIVMRGDKADKDERTVSPIAARIARAFDIRREEIKGDELWAIFLDGQSEIIDIVKIREEFGIPTENEAYFILQKGTRCHGTAVIFAHVTGGLEIYPTNEDNQLFKLMRDTLSVTNLELLAYYMVGGDEILELHDI